MRWNFQNHKSRDKTYSEHIPTPICNVRKLLIRVSVRWRQAVSRRLLCSRLSTNFITGCSHDNNSLLGDERCLVTTSLLALVTSSPKCISSRQREMLTWVALHACHDVHSINHSSVSVTVVNISALSTQPCTTMLLMPRWCMYCYYNWPSFMSFVQHNAMHCYQGCTNYGVSTIRPNTNSCSSYSAAYKE